MGPRLARGTFEGVGGDPPKEAPSKPAKRHLASSGVIWRHLASSGLIWPHLASSGASDLGGSNFQKNPVVSNKPISLCEIDGLEPFWGLGWLGTLFEVSGKGLGRGLGEVWGN